MIENSTLKSTNRAVLGINILLDLFLILGYIVEYLKGGRDLSYIIIFMLLTIIPITAAIIMYFNKKDNKNLKYITLIGYGIIYIFVLFTSTRTLVYAYFFPIITMYFLYFDLKLMVIACSSITVLNIIRVIYFVVGLKMNDSNVTTDYTIQLVTVIMFSIALVVSTRLSNKFNQEKINSLNEEKEKQDGILSDVLKVATLLDHHSLKVYEIVEEMVSSIENITISMSNIAKGASNTADSIQEQSQLTNEIQTTIVDTSNVSNNIEAGVYTYSIGINPILSHIVCETLLLIGSL